MALHPTEAKIVLLIEADLSYEDIGEELSLNRDTVRKWERGLRERFHAPTRMELPALVRAAEGDGALEDAERDMAGLLAELAVE